MVIGSKGCGLIYIAESDRATYRTRTAPLGEAGFDKVADNLRQFLPTAGAPPDTVQRRSGEPGHL